MSKNFLLAIIAVLSVWCIGCASAAPPSEPEVEVGSVQWGRDLAQAKQTSAATGKPLMLLFQEVPG